MYQKVPKKFATGQESYSSFEELKQNTKTSFRLSDISQICDDDIYKFRFNVDRSTLFTKYRQLLAH